MLTSRGLKAASIALPPAEQCDRVPSFGVLLYYLVANLSAVTRDGVHRRFPRALQVVGAAGCAVLVATLPLSSVLAGLAVFGVGVGYRLVRLRWSGAHT